MIQKKIPLKKSFIKYTHGLFTFTYRFFRSLYEEKKIVMMYS